MVPVVDGVLATGEHPSFVVVGFVEGFVLTDGGWPPYACHDVFDAVFGAEVGEGGQVSSWRVELGSPVGEYLVRLPMLVDAVF